MAAPSSDRFLLWVDAVGGYLVCCGEQIVLGQATPGNAVDVPIQGGLARQHATIRRDAEGYLLEPTGDTRLDWRPLRTSAVLSDGGLIELGHTIKRGVVRGGFGEFYYAVSDGGKEVALKLLRRNFDIELRGVAQCLNLRHPHLLSLYDIRTDDRDDHWVVMEYVSGTSLDEVIAAHPDGLAPAEALSWLAGLAAGVGYLHQCGIVHRDLKPSNIFSDAGLVKIGDYGLAKFISCSRRSGQTESGIVLIVAAAATEGGTVVGSSKVTTASTTGTLVVAASELNPVNFATNNGDCPLAKTWRNEGSDNGN